MVTACLLSKGRKGRVFMSETWKKWLESQSAEFQAKAAKCTTQDDFMDLVGSEGIRLPDEIMDGIAGGTHKPWKN